MFNGEIVFDIADEEHVEVDLGAEIIPTKIVKKGDVVVLGRKAPKNRWMYKISYSNEKEYLESLEKMANQLSDKAEYVNKLARTYAEIGCSIPSHILKKLSVLDCPLNFSVFSFGMAIDV